MDAPPGDEQIEESHAANHAQLICNDAREAGFRVGGAAQEDLSCELIWVVMLEGGEPQKLDRPCFAAILCRVGKKPGKVWYNHYYDVVCILTFWCILLITPDIRSIAVVVLVRDHNKFYQFSPSPTATESYVLLPTSASSFRRSPDPRKMRRQFALRLRLGSESKIPWQLN